MNSEELDEIIKLKQRVLDLEYDMQSLKQMIQNIFILLAPIDKK